MVLNKGLKIYGADLDLTAPALVFCDAVKHTVPMRDAGYIDNLLSICKEDGIALIIPTIDTDLLVLSENKARSEVIGTHVLISGPDKIRLCRDKNLTSQFFIDCGLKAPLPVNDVNKWNEKHGSSGYPAFIKPKDGSSSINASSCLVALWGERSKIMFMNIPPVPLLLCSFILSKNLNGSPSDDADDPACKIFEAECLPRNAHC